MTVLYDQKNKVNLMVLFYLELFHVKINNIEDQTAFQPVVAFYKLDSEDVN